MDVISDLREANRCIQELAAISLLPAIWSGGAGQPDQIRESLADGLQSCFRSAIIYVRCADGAGAALSKPAIRFQSLRASEAIMRNLTVAVEEALAGGNSDLAGFCADGMEFRLVVMSLGPAQEFGVIAVGSTRADFPSASERILLNVSVNQAIIAFRAARQVAAVRRSERDLRDFVENATVGIHWVSGEGIIIWANQTELNLLGYGSEEYVGHHIAEFHADACIIHDILTRLTRGETLQEYEARLRCKDGSIRHVLINSNVLFEDGKFIHTRSFTRDISQRILAEKALAEAAEQRRLALEAAALGAWDFRLETGDIIWDERCRNLWGISEGSALDLESVLQRLNPLDRPSTRQAIAAALAGVNQGCYHSEFRVVWPDQSEHWIASRGQVYFEGEGAQRHPIRFIGIVREITEEKRAREAIETSERELRSLANSIPQLAWMAEPNGDIFWYNRGWYEYTGTKAPQMEGWGWQAVHDPKMLPLVLERWQQSIRSGEPFEMEFPLRGGDGVFRWFLTRVKPVRDHEGRVLRWFGTNTDVEEVRRTQEKLRDETRVLELLNKTGTAIASQLDLQELVQTVTDAGKELSGAQFGAFFYNVINEQGESFFLYTLSGAPREAFEKFGLPRNTPVFNPTFRGEGVLRSPDITRDPRYGTMPPHHGMPQGHPPVRSYLAVPVISRSGEVIGGLFFGHSEANIFSERSERIIVGIAAQAAIAIDNARLYDSAQKEIAERTRVEAALATQIRLTVCRAEIGSALAANDPLKAVLRRCTESLVKHLHAAFARIWTVNPAENMLELRASSGLYQHLDGRHARIKVGEFKIGRIAQKGGAHWTNDVLHDSEISDPAWAKAQGMVAFAGYPLIVDQRVLGVVAIFTREPIAAEVLQELVLIADGLAQWIHRIQVEEAFREGAERLQLALKAGQLGDWNWDARTDLLFLGTRAAEILGLPTGVPTTWAQLHEMLPEGDRERAGAAMVAALANRADYDMEYRIQGAAPHEQRWIGIKGRGIHGEGGVTLGMTGVVQDITADKRASEVLEQTVQERTARLKETIAELEAFSYSISHDMRSPLRAMQGYAEVLLENHKDQLDEAGANYLERIRRGASRLDVLIQDVLAYSKIAKGEVALKTVELETIISEVIENYPQLQSCHASIHIAAPLPKIIGHEAYLTQIVSNLLGNAVKFVLPGMKPEVRVWAEAEEPLVRIWFEDNGIGIEPRHHPDIFQIFGRVYSDRKYEGTGIGLAIVKKAVERMGGSIGVLSELGKGSRFWITLKSAS